jgi:hypothetical protein
MKKITVCIHQPIDGSRHKVIAVNGEGVIIPTAEEARNIEALKNHEDFEWFMKNGGFSHIGKTLQEFLSCDRIKLVKSE